MKKRIIEPTFVVINNNDEFFVGLFDGGRLKWDSNPEGAKEFTDDNKTYIFDLYLGESNYQKMYIN